MIVHYEIINCVRL